MTLKSFIEHTLPTSAFDSMARNEILQIVVFSLFFGTAMAAMGERSRTVLDVLDVVSHIMLKVTNYVMLFAPLAVLGALASTVAKEGLGIIGVYGVFIGEFYLGLVVLWGILIAFGALIVGPSVLRLVRRIREPVLLAFSTASSEAAYPRTLEELERFGCSNRVASFVLPVGYSFNLDGSMMYCTFAVMFIAQVYGVEISIGQQVMMIAVLMLTSKGIAGVPRASLVVVAAALTQFNLPEAGHVAAPRNRPLPRHGPLGDERRRQQHRDRDRVEVGRRITHSHAHEERGCARVCTCCAQRGACALNAVFAA